VPGDEEREQVDVVHRCRTKPESGKAAKFQLVDWWMDGLSLQSSEHTVVWMPAGW
jgi:hypothetical protein